jgi:hypothetical protein
MHVAWIGQSVCYIYRRVLVSVQSQCNNVPYQFIGQKFNVCIQLCRIQLQIFWGEIMQIGISSFVCAGLAQRGKFNSSVS